MDELRLKGIAASPGVALGTAFCHKSHVIETTRETLSANEIPDAVKRFFVLWQQSLRDLEAVRDRMAARGNKQQADILEAQISILDDPLLGEKVKEKISAGKNPGWAVEETFSEFAIAFAKMSSAYIRERVVDLRDVGEMVLRAVMGVPATSFADMREPAIVVASHLTASDLAQLDFLKVLGLVLETGSKTSHTAIIARGQGIPAIVGLDKITYAIAMGDPVAIDGEQGLVWVRPSEAQLELLRGKAAQESVQSCRNLRELEVPCRTRDGQDIVVGANVGGAEEVPDALKNGADEIGLFRTEFVFLERRELPSIEEQFEIYKAAVLGMGQKPVIIRTLDVGGDKMIPGIVLDQEENPFLGVRGVRLCLENRELFKTHITAILRASAFGRLKIMIPMVTELREVLETKALIREVAETLTAEGIDFDPDIPVGIMIEVPLAAMQVRVFAPHVDFFSIGTNDLLQYMVAVDRGNAKLSSLYDSCHPAFLALVAKIIGDAHASNKPIGMCGELAGDPLFTLFLLGVGLDECFFSSASIAGLKYLIRRVSKSEAEYVAKQVLEMASAEDVRLHLRQLSEQIAKRIEVDAQAD